MISESEFARWLAVVVAKNGGEVTLTEDDVNQPVDLTISVAEDNDGNETGLIIRATVEKES